MTRSVLAILGDPQPFGPIIEWIRRRGLAVQIATTARDALRAHGETAATLVLVGLPLPDAGASELLRELQRQDPRSALIVCGRDAEVESLARALELGAAEYVADPDAQRRDLLYALGVLLGLRDGDIQLRIDRARELAQTQGIVGRCAMMQPAMAKLRELCDRTLSGAAPRVLLIGEVGTGKRLFAKCLHYNGARRGRLFLEISCANREPEDLREILFGRERPTRRGLFEMAAGGTVFLDEIAAVPLALQRELLRAMEDKLVMRAGGGDEIEIDVQIIASTQRDLASLVKRGELREDLYHRLSVQAIELPPLRERGDDIVEIAERMIAAVSAELALAPPRLADDARGVLLRHAWPGNMRELRIEMERVVLLIEGDVITADHLRARDRGVVAIDGSDAGLVVTVSGDRCPLEDVEREVIRQALVKTGGNISRAARFLAVTRQTLLYRMKKYGFASPSSPGNLGESGSGTP